MLSEYIAITEDTRQSVAKKILTAFPAFYSRNYQLYFGGQLVSLIGTWLQAVAQGYLIYELTKSAFWVGLVAALNYIPVMIFALFGGVIVDRYNKRNILYITQTMQMILAFALGVLTLLHIVNEYYIAAFAFLLGVSTAIDMPARQTFVNEIVDKRNLSSAISLNAGMFNAARVIGPASAGLLVALIGVGGAFIINGISFIAVIFALYSMRLNLVVHNDHPHPLRSIAEGIRYAWNHSIVRSLLAICLGLSVFGWSYTTIMPVIASEVFHVGADGLGYLQAAAGLGAVFGAILVSSYSKKIHPSSFIFGGAYLFVISIFLFSFVSHMFIALCVLFFSGLGLIMAFSTINSTIQHSTEMRIRGRVMSLYTLMFIGMSPVGNVELGYVTQVYGSRIGLQLNSVILFILLTLIFVTQKHLRKID